MINLGTLFGADPGSPNSNPFGLIELSGVCTEATIIILSRNLILLIIFALLIIAIVMILLNGGKIVSSFGNADKAGEGFTGIRNALVGLFLAFIVFIVVYIISGIFWPNAARINETVCNATGVRAIIITGCTGYPNGFPARYACVNGGATLNGVRVTSPSNNCGIAEGIIESRGGVYNAPDPSFCANL